MTWQEADAFCSGGGARLCSADELQSNEAANTGCGTNGASVWSSTVCEGGMVGAFGSSIGGSDTSCDAVEVVKLVRCCADVEVAFEVAEGEPTPTPTQAPTLQPTASPSTLAPTTADQSAQLLVTSALTCDELGWTNAASFGSPGVCGESDGFGECSGDLNWPDAAAFCEEGGARLCTVDELEADEARGTGCGFDGLEVWSATVCSDGFSVAFGATIRGTDSSCAASTAEYPVRCCADVTLASRKLREDGKWNLRGSS